MGEGLKRAFAAANATQKSDKITARKFKAAVGWAPWGDDLERCNCPDRGKPGHFSCGWDYRRNMPNFIPTPSQPQ